MNVCIIKVIACKSLFQNNFLSGKQITIDLLPKK